MPHLGKPSAACKTCKQRHVKCDESRPGCNRCLKSNRVCPGYTEGLDLVLRDQYDVAKASVSRREKASQKARRASDNLKTQARNGSAPSDSLVLSSSSSSYSSDGSEELVISPSYLAPPEAEYQLCLFMGTWATFPHDVQGDRGFLELIPSVYSAAKIDSPLALCVAAISGALSGKFIEGVRNVDTPNVRRKYTEALTATRRALQSPIESLTDETLLAICLLGFYEGVVASTQGRLSSAQHYDGAAALINQRQGRIRTDMGKRLLFGIRNSILLRAVACGTAMDTSSPLWQTSEPVTHNVATLLDQMSMDIPNLLVATSRCLNETQESEPNKSSQNISQTKRDTINAALSIDATLSTWPTSTPSSWTPHRLPLHSIPKSITAIGGVYQSHCDIYLDIQVCETWNSYRISRLRTLSALASLLPPPSPSNSLSSPSSALSSSLSTLRTSTISRIQSLADAISASVPYCMGDRTAPAPLYSTSAIYPTIDGKPPSADQHRTAVAVGGWCLFSPMKEVMRVGRWLRPGQMAWMGGQLMRLARVYDVDPVDDWTGMGGNGR